MGYFLGFDGGGTKRRSASCSMPTARIIGDGQGGPSNPLRSGYDVAFRSLGEAAAEALRKANLNAKSISGVCAGLGWRRQAQRGAPGHGLSGVQEFPDATTSVTTDCEIAFERLPSGPVPESY